MADTCYVRYPDDKKDDPDEPGSPNRPVEISVQALDDYRSRGFVQCGPEGEKLAPNDIIPVDTGVPEDVELAGADDDSEAKKLHGEAADTPAPKPAASAPAAASKGET